MEKRLYGVRGAVFAENSADGIMRSVDELFEGIFTKNPLDESDIVSIQFTVTPDLRALNPATALRKSSHGQKASACALFCAQEPVTDGASLGTIRTLVTAYFPAGCKPVHVYANGAEILRPDLISKK
jgi:chorismate mutase